MTVPEYVADTRFVVLCLATFGSCGQPSANTGESVRQVLAAIDWTNVTVSFHNAKFDAYILAQRYHIHPRYIVDTLDIARAWNPTGSHKLKDLASEFKLAAKGNTLDFMGQTVATPELCRYAENDVRIQWEIFKLLVPKLSSPATELKAAQSILELSTQPSLHCDVKLGKLLADNMVKETATIVKNTKLTQEEISGNISFTGAISEAIKEAGENPQKYFKLGKKGYLLAASKVDPERETLLYHRSSTVRNLMAARIAVKSTPLHVKRIEKLIRIATAAGGLLPVSLHYHGAITGRTTGADGTNFQNLTASVCNLLTAAPGNRLITCDLSAIEARVIAWLAGEEQMLEVFRDPNRDIYKEFAATVLAKNALHVTADERQKIGKVGILGCSYGMAANSVQSPRETNLWFRQAGLSIDQSQLIVDTYRSQYTAIVNFWHELERAAVFALCKKQPAQVGYIRYESHPDCNLVAILPSGRLMRYHNVHVDPHNFSRIVQKRNGGYTSLWHGLLAENVTQAVARDILIEAILRIEQFRIKHCLQVHDSIVVQAKTGDINLMKSIIEDEMTRPPTWAKDLPLACKSKIGYRYAK